MNLVTGAIGNLAPKLLQLLQDEYKLQKGLRKKIEFVSEELESIHGALQKVADVPPDQLDEQVKIWARQVREASYDMEDVLDNFLVHVEGCPEPAGKGRLKRTLKKLTNLFTKAKARRGIASAIEDIKEKIEEVSKRRDRCKVDEIGAKPASTSTIDPRLEAMYKEVTELVGINKAMDELLSMLSVHRDEISNEKLKIVSVHGVGGLGKTTLAKALYDKLKPQFGCGAFVPLGRNPDLKKVFRDILIELDKDKYTNSNMIILDERQLINELKDFLRSKRYFIVIDDVWDEKSWETIKLALVENNRGSIIISTTRIFDVTCGEVYRLQPLSYDNSKRLFYARIFGGEGKFPDNQVDEVSDKIVKKCGGIPLAIITMASCLVGKSKEEWSKVCNSVGFHDKSNKQVDKTMWILSLSYYDLPCELRTCLLYLSVFPEDYIIEKHSLIWKWVAEGFVHKKEGLGLFEVGEGYFNDLINRSMIQAVESENSGIIDGCRVHDMVLDLIRYLSREENFVTILGNDEGTSSISSARRLAHQNRIIDHTQLDNHKGMPKLRSFIAHGCEAYKGLSLPSFKRLRVLALEHVYMGCCPDVKHLESLLRLGPFRLKDTVACDHVKDIDNLLHLRYLGIRNTTILELPKEIGALKFLQILDLDESRLKELPSSVGLLTQLVCLRVRWIIVPDGIIKKLTSLEELQVAYSRSVKGNFLKDLRNLTELRVLRITATDEKVDGTLQSDLLQSVGNLHKIQRLELDSGLYKAAVLDKAACDSVMLHGHLRHLLLPSIRFCRLPSCFNPSYLNNLSHLQLCVESMDEQGLKILCGLPELRYLNLSTWSTVTVANIAVDGCFQKLRYCTIGSSMVQFVVNEDSSVSFTIWNGTDDIAFGSRKKDECIVAPAIMPNLEELSFRVDLASMVKCNGSYDNLGLEYLTALQKVTVDWSWWDCSDAEVMEAEAALRHTIDVHPNHSTYQLSPFSQMEFEVLRKMWSQNQIRRGKEAIDGDKDLATEEQEGEISSPVDDDITGSGEGGDDPTTPALSSC